MVKSFQRKIAKFMPWINEKNNSKINILKKIKFGRCGKNDFIVTVLLPGSHSKISGCLGYFIFRHQFNLLR